MFHQLTEIIISKFQLEPDEVDDDVRLDDLGLDSLDLVELALIIEKEFGVRVTDDELAGAQRLRAIVELLEARSAKV
jgi:acyl carrier protein